MRKLLKYVIVAVAMACMALPAYGEWSFMRALSGMVKAAKAVTLTDDDVADYVKEYIDWMDKENTVCGAQSPYTRRLRRLTAGLADADGIPLNFKVYDVKEVNAFACADGSVRIFSALMDAMTDEQLLGVIGHEIGHVAHRDSKKAFRQALLTSALRDGLAASSDRLAALSDSQLGELGAALMSAKYSRRQEREADDFGYEFLKSAGRNPRAMAMSFRKLKELQGNVKMSRLNQLFSSHPDLDERIERMESRATADGIAHLE